MRNYALIAKVMSRRGSRHCGDTSGLLHFVRSNGQCTEKNFLKTFINGLESDVQDLQYYMSLWRGAKQLQKPHSAAMQRILGTEIDLQNIIWSYRLKKYYGIFGDTTYGFLVPIRHRLQANIFSQMISCQSADGIQTILSDTIYRDIFGDFSNAQKCLTNAVKARYLAEERHSHIALLCGFLYEVYQ